MNQKKADAQFYIYWRQNIPGCNNKIAYENNKQITNWWQFIGDWDAAINGNNGLYYFTQTEIAVNSLNQEASNFNLCQNYPNPFNAATTFKYTIPQKSHIRIDIWNVLGQHVITLADAPMSAGKYSINWTGVNYLGEKVSSGIYFVVFNAKSKTSEYVTTRKLLLIQ